MNCKLDILRLTKVFMYHENNVRNRISHGFPYVSKRNFLHQCCGRLDFISKVLFQFPVLAVLPRCTHSPAPMPDHFSRCFPRSSIQGASQEESLISKTNSLLCFPPCLWHFLVSHIGSHSVFLLPSAPALYVKCHDTYPPISLSLLSSPLSPASLLWLIARSFPSPPSLILVKLRLTHAAFLLTKSLVFPAWTKRSSYPRLCLDFS